VQPRQPGGCVGQHLVSLAEGESHLSPTGGPVIVKDDVRHGDHPAAVRERAAELEAIWLAEDGDIRRDEIGALPRVGPS
jgi:hypothetical protein